MPANAVDHGRFDLSGAGEARAPAELVGWMDSCTTRRKLVLRGSPSHGKAIERQVGGSRQVGWQPPVARPAVARPLLLTLWSLQKGCGVIAVSLVPSRQGTTADGSVSITHPYLGVGKLE